MYKRFGMEGQTIDVRRDYDVIVARSRVRDLARRAGLGTTDQARISLATSSLARVMGLGRLCDGQITVECLEDARGVAVRVVCKASSDPGLDLSPGTFREARVMTDELTVERLPLGEIWVTMVKRPTGRPRNVDGF